MKNFYNKERLDKARYSDVSSLQSVEKAQLSLDFFDRLTPRSMQPHGTGRCIMDQARRCCSSQTIRVGFSALMRRARTVNTRMVSSVKTTSHTAR